MKKTTSALVIVSFLILVINRILIYGFDSSIKGFLIERIVFFIFMLSSIVIAQHFKYKKIIYLGIAFILITNLIRPFTTGLVCTNSEIRINNNYYLRESTSIASDPVYHIMQRKNWIEQNITSWNPVLQYDEEFQELKKIKKIHLLKNNSNGIILKYETSNKIMIDTFKLRSYY